MKILFTWHAAVEPEYRKLFKEMSTLGHELVVVTPRSWTEGGRAQRIDKEEKDGYTLLPLPVMFENRVKRFFYPSILRQIRLLYGFKPDILHIFEEPYSLSCFQFTALSKALRPEARVIVESFENIKMPQRFPFSFTERFVLKRADMLIAIPGEGKDVWASKGFSKPILQVPVGLDANLFKRTGDSITGCEFLDKRDRVRIAYVGRLTRDKGVDLLIEAVASLVNTLVDCELLIVGSGDKDVFKSLAERLGIPHKVIFIDAMQNRFLPALYSKTDILVLPSRTTEHWKEQFGRVLTEAMACEVAVVGSSSGEIPEVIGDAGLVFKEGDKDALAGVLKSLVEDEGLRKAFGQSGRRRVLENFTWKKVAQGLTKVYNEALNQNKC